MNRTTMTIAINQVNLRAMFAQKGLGDNNRAVAKALGISAFTLNQFYHKREVSPQTVVKIANALGVQPTDIATESTPTN